MDIPLLKYLDILIGLSVAMLIVSTVVMALAQVLLTSSYARARYLAEGLGELLGQLDPVLLAEHQEYLAQRILRHPMIGRANTWFGRATGKLRNKWLRHRKKLPLPRVNPGAVVQREELLAILLEWASGEGPMAQQDREMLLEGTDREDAALVRVREALAKALRDGGIADPAAVAKRVRQLTLEQERANPQLPSSQWRAQAVLGGAASDFTWKLFSWHDNALVRTKAAFALEARVWSCLLAGVVCVGAQFDGLELIKRLSTDDKYRAAMVAKTAVAQEQYERAAKDARVAQENAGATLQNNEATPKEKDEATKKVAEETQKAEAAERKVAETAATMKDPLLNVAPVWGKDYKTEHTPGILFSWVLVSLGATFWYDLLKKLTGLRSVLAKKDEEERTARDESQQAPGTTTAAAAPTLVTVVDSTPKLVGIVTATRLRSGCPEEAAPEVAVLGADTLVSIASTVRAANGTKWYQTPDGDYFPVSATDQA